MAEYVEFSAKSALNDLKHQDTWFGCRYTLNPYRGCEHACVYCDAASEKYNVGGESDFGKVVFVKRNIAELLEREAQRLAKRGAVDVVGPGGVCDAYQPVEGKYGLMRRVLSVLASWNFPVHVVTKSDLVVRDADLLEKISDRSFSAVTFTITTLDKKLVSKLEPFAPTPARRLEAMRRLSEQGVRVGVVICPIVPFLEDEAENIESVVEAAVDCGAGWVLGGSMTLRDRQRKRFLLFLEKNFPGLVEKYEKLYGNAMHPRDRSYLLGLNRLVASLCKKHGVKNFMPRFVPRNARFPLNWECHNLLMRIAHLSQLRLDAWYKTNSYVAAAQNVRSLKRNILDLFSEKRLSSVPGVGVNIEKKLSEFLETGRSHYLDEWVI